MPRSNAGIPLAPANIVNPTAVAPAATWLMLRLNGYTTHMSATGEVSLTHTRLDCEGGDNRWLNKDVAKPLPV